MKLTLKQMVRIRSARFVWGCLFAVLAFAISLLRYDNLKAGVFLLFFF